MARDFTKNTSNYMSLGANALGPLIHGQAIVSMLARVNIDTFTAGIVGKNNVFWVGINSNLTGLGFNFADSGGGNKLRLLARSAAADNGRWHDSTATVTTGEHTVGAVINYTSKTIRLYIDGVQDSSGLNGGTGTWGSNTYVQGTATNIDMIGAQASGSGPADTTVQMDGRISELAIFGGDIGTDSFAAFHAGFSPEMLSLPPIAYFPLLGVDSPERDHWGGLSGTITGTVAAADHPSIILPGGLI